MDETEQRIIDLIEEHRQEPVFCRDIEGHPEPGFQEVRTAKKTAELLKKYGYEVQEGIALTGVQGRTEQPGRRSRNGYPEQEKTLQEKRPGKVSEYFSDGEMDAIGCKAHPMADAPERHSPRLRPPCSDGCAGRGGNGFCRS